MKLDSIVPQAVDFHNQALITLQKDNIAYVAMKPICENIGLDWESFFTKTLDFHHLQR